MTRWPSFCPTCLLSVSPNSQLLCLADIVCPLLVPEVLSKFIILWVHPMEKAELGEWDINTAKVGGLFLSRWLSNEDLLSCDRGTLEKKVLQERKEARWVPTAPCLSSQSLYGSPKQGGGWGMG